MAGFFLAQLAEEPYSSSQYFIACPAIPASTPCKSRPLAGTALRVSPDVRKRYCFIKMALASWLGDCTMKE